MPRVTPITTKDQVTLSNDKSLTLLCGIGKR